MYIKKILSQHRRDFRAIFACKSCGHEEERSGYDDRHFHQNVVPDMECKECGEKAGEDYAPRGTKYPDGMQV